MRLVRHSLERISKRGRGRSLFNWRLCLKLVLIAAIVGSGGYYGYATGLILAQREVTRLQGRINDLGRTIVELEKYNEVISQAAEEATLNETRWRERYEALAADEAFGRKFADARGREGKGLDASRLAFAVGGQRNGLTCTDRHISKRFKVHTPVNSDGYETAGFANNQIIVSANGISAVSQGGQALAWFDPKQPVAVKFTTLDGQSTVANGIVPLTHTVVVDNAEYRFRVERSARGFLEVTGNRCG